MSNDDEWNAELDRRGVAFVVAMLSVSEVGAGRGAEFKLYIPGMQNPSRGYVEDWVARKVPEAKAEAKAKDPEAKATETKRWRYGLAVGVLGIVVAIVICWFR